MKIKVLLFCAACFLAMTSAVFAADSLCLLGDDGKIAVTTYEHRAAADTRATIVTLVFGSYILRGKLHDVDAGAITLREAGAAKNSYPKFVGNINVNYQTYQIKLKGALIFASDVSLKIHTILPCKVLEPKG